MVVMKMVSTITKSTKWIIGCFTFLLMRRVLRGKIVRFVERMSPYALHGSREGSTNCHKLGRFVNAPMAFYICIPFILALELISLTFFLVFRLFSSILQLFSIVRLFSNVQKGRRRYVPTPRGSLGTLGPYRFRLLTRRHSRSFHQLRYNGNPVTAKICSHGRVRVEILTRTGWFSLCWKFIIFHGKFMCGVSLTQPLFALPLYHSVPPHTLPTVGRLLPPQSVRKTILNFPKRCFQTVL